MNECPYCDNLNEHDPDKPWMGVMPPGIWECVHVLPNTTECGITIESVTGLPQHRWVYYPSAKVVMLDNLRRSYNILVRD